MATIVTIPSSLPEIIITIIDHDTSRFLPRRSVRGGWPPEVQIFRLSLVAAARTGPPAGAGRDRDRDRDSLLGASDLGPGPYNRTTVPGPLRVYARAAATFKFSLGVVRLGVPGGQ